MRCLRITSLFVFFMMYVVPVLSAAIEEKYHKHANIQSSYMGYSDKNHQDAALNELLKEHLSLMNAQLAAHVKSSNRIIQKQTMCFLGVHGFPGHLVAVIHTQSGDFEVHRSERIPLTSWYIKEIDLNRIVLMHPNHRHLHTIFVGERNDS